MSREQNQTHVVNIIGPHQDVCSARDHLMKAAYAITSQHSWDLRQSSSTEHHLVVAFPSQDEADQFRESAGTRKNLRVGQFALTAA
jgi:hypothetical protein